MHRRRFLGHQLSLKENCPVPTPVFPTSRNTLDIELYFGFHLWWLSRLHNWKIVAAYTYSKGDGRDFFQLKRYHLKEASHISPKALPLVENQLHSSIVGQFHPCGMDTNCVSSPLGTGWLEAVAYGWLLKQIKIKPNRNFWLFSPSRILKT